MKPTPSEIMRIYVVIVAIAASALFLSPELRADQSITIRSGNGVISSQDNFVRVLAFHSTGDITPTPANFAAAQTAPYAYVVAPDNAWIASIPADNSARWIAVTPNRSPGSALFAVPFQVTDTVITAATLDLNFAVDNALNGVFINGTRISGNSFDGDYHAQYRFVRADIAPLLIPNSTNWLYLNMSDYGAVAGIIFSAAITTTGGVGRPIIPSRGGNGGTVTTVISGAGFSDGDEVKLSSPGQTDIIGNFPTVLSPNQIITTFDLRSQAPGEWNASVTDANGQLILSAPFTVEIGGNEDLSVEVIGPSKVRSWTSRDFRSGDN